MEKRGCHNIESLFFACMIISVKPLIFQPNSLLQISTNDINYNDKSSLDPDLDATFCQVPSFSVQQGDAIHPRHPANFRQTSSGSPPLALQLPRVLSECLKLSRPWMIDLQRRCSKHFELQQGIDNNIGPRVDHAASGLTIFASPAVVAGRSTDSTASVLTGHALSCPSLFFATILIQLDRLQQQHKEVVELCVSTVLVHGRDFGTSLLRLQA
jgi:hypothetical protein